MTDTRFNDIVNRMTNYERNQWAKAKYPGLRHKEIKKLEPYADAAIRKLDGKVLILAGPDAGEHPKHA